MKKIYTLPVYSQIAENTPDEIVRLLPPKWKLSQHQLDTYMVMNARTGPDIVFNTAMTGDGKSLAGQLNALITDGPYTIFGMYPTNELIRDQLRQTESTWFNGRNSHRPNDWIAMCLINLWKETT